MENIAEPNIDWAFGISKSDMANPHFQFIALNPISFFFKKLPHHRQCL
jgi:hypothetical protein